MSINLRRAPSILAPLVFVSLWTAAPLAEPGGELQLVTQAELDALPDETPVRVSRRPPSADGPRIQIDSPTPGGIYDGPFPIKVAFLPGPAGHAVDIESLRVEYKRAWGIDITDRVREFVVGTVIDIEHSRLPRGRHTVEIEIADVARNLSRRSFTVTVE